MSKREWSYPEVGSRWKLRSIPEAEVVILPRRLYGMVTFSMRAYEDEDVHVHELALAWFYAAHVPLDKYREEDDYEDPRSTRRP